MNARVTTPPRTQVFNYWVDAKHRARTVAIIHGYSVIVMDYDQFEVIYADTVEACLTLANGRKLEAEFNELGQEQ